MVRSSGTIVRVLWFSFLLGAIDPLTVVPAFTAWVHEWSLPHQTGIWAVALYILVYGFSFPVTTHVIDRYGRQFILSVALALFGLGALTSGFAPNFSFFLAGRLLQGIAAGGLVSLSLPVILRRDVAFFPSWRQVTLTLMAIVLPLLSGWGAMLFSWRFIFYVQLLVSFIGFALVFRSPTRQGTTHQPFDFGGMALLFFVSVCLTVGVSRIFPDRFGETFLSENVFPFIAVGLGLIVPFIMLERLHERPFVPLLYFQRERAVLRFAASLLVGMSSAGLLFVPPFAEVLFRLKVGEGAYVAALFVAIFVVALSAARLIVERFSPQLRVVTGLLMLASGFLTLGTFVQRAWHFAIALLCLGVGFSSVLHPLFKQYGRRVPLGEKRVWAIERLWRVIGATIGASWLVTFLAQAIEGISARVRQSLIASPSSSQELTGGPLAKLVEQPINFAVLDESELRQLIPEEIDPVTQDFVIRQIMNTVRQSLIDGYRDLFVTATVCALLAFVAALIVWRGEKADG